MKSETSINNSILILYLQHKFWLEMISFVVAKILFSQTYQLFFHIFYRINIAKQLYFYGRLIV